MTIFGGAAPHELDFLSFSDMARAESWELTPTLNDIRQVMRSVGAENTVLSIYFRQPYVLDEASGMLDAGAIVGTFGVSDAALMDVLTGDYSPSGKLPFALGNSPEAVVLQDPDSPGYPEADTLFEFGFGLSYE